MSSFFRRTDLHLELRESSLLKELELELELVFKGDSLEPDTHRMALSPKCPPPNLTLDEILMNGSLCCQTEYFPEMNVAERRQSRLQEIANNKCPGIVSDYIMYCMCTCESIKRLGS
ncbi:hypothetical protein CDAR_524541 [Caerostris darwini]|uniref:Uncharacterized protein n=1 Tax=Caerostris darwini TaxID=1538125 RepID=A0AAV4VW99_9ARAC|nr:hypothetical protein CDAR_524541 [Caerostris darwini]